MRELRDEIVTLRTARKCDWCCGCLMPGQKARHMVGFQEGHFTSVYYCQQCDNELHAHTCYATVGAGGWELC